MKAKTIENGNIKVWFDCEEEFVIINKNEPLIDTLIDANLLQRKYSKMLVEDVRDAGLDDIHDVFIDVDDSLETKLDKLNINELNIIFDEFNSILNTQFKFHKNPNGLISIVLREFENYEDFKKNYYGVFLIKLFAFKIDIIKSEEQNDSIRGLTGFISKFAEDYLRIYLETSRKRKFAGVLRVK